MFQLGIETCPFRIIFILSHLRLTWTRIEHYFTKMRAKENVYETLLLQAKPTAIPFSEQNVRLFLLVSSFQNSKQTFVQLFETCLILGQVTMRDVLSLTSCTKISPPSLKGISFIVSWNEKCQKQDRESWMFSLRWMCEICFIPLTFSVSALLTFQFHFSFLHQNWKPSSFAHFPYRFHPLCYFFESPSPDPSFTERKRKKR